MNKNPYKTNIQIVLLEECVISSVLSRYGKILKQWKDRCYSSMLQLSFIWQAKENTSSRCEGQLTQKTRREEKPPAQFWLLFLYVFSPHPEPALCKLGRPGGLFVLPEVLTPSPWTFLCSVFMGFSLSLSFSHPYFGLLFPILTT